MRILLFDDHLRNRFFPLAFTRPLGLLRTGILTQQESWANHLGSMPTFLTVPELAGCHPPVIGEENLLINARWLVFSAYRQDVDALQMGEALVQDGIILAAKCTADDTRLWQSTLSPPKSLNTITYNKEGDGQPALLLTQLTDLFHTLNQSIDTDFRQVCHGRVSETPDASVTILGDPDKVFIEPGARVEACYLNTRSGPIYIGADSQVMEGAVIHGPVALAENVTVRAGARIYGATTIGPHSKVAGEISNSVIQGYSNKAHDGFLGNSILGEWCNLGADTNTSNLKNNYSEVKIWSYAAHDFVSTGLTFCGLIMGDHSKCGINTMFNTGTTVGVSANIFGGGFPPKYIPSFAWGGADGFETYALNKALETAERVLERRNLKLSDEQRRLFALLHENAK